MRYYEVLVSSQRYHGQEYLTYSSGQPLKKGVVVEVPLQRQKVLGVIVSEVTKPSFQSKEILRCVTEKPIPVQLLDLIAWLRDYYPAPLGQLAGLLLPATLAVKSRSQPEKIIRPQATPPPPLTTEQRHAVSDIQSKSPASVLLHGNTGTGKTRVYLELAQKALEENRSVVVLTPEIGLTPQLVNAFELAFPHQTTTIHSELTPQARRIAWLNILHSDEPTIIIGPRSALFSPIANLGLIIIDEFHDGAYKQEQAPYYQASRVAAKLASLHGGQLILGSATPSVVDYFTFSEKNLPIIRMQEQALERTGESTPVIVDLKQRALFSRSPWLSDPLLDAIQDAIQKKEQSLLFLNRRGTARVILCQSCGWQALCPRCDLPLTYHDDKHNMQCHTCGYQTNAPAACPSCSDSNIIFKSIGTKSVVRELERLFPQSSIMRFDSDTLKEHKLERVYTSVRDGSVDILVGTQMIAKGLDLPRLSVLGVVLADTSLSFPDYTAEERTFQLLNQVIGRVNRGHVAGVAFIQTQNPDNTVIKAALQKDYPSFYSHQIRERKLFALPPFRYALKLTCLRASSKSAQKAAENLKEQLQGQGLQIEIIGPSPAFTEKIQNKYRWQLVIKAIRRDELLKIIRDLPANWSYDIDPMNLL